MKSILSKFLLALSLSASFIGYSQIVINEINYNSSDDFNPDDWVELYNNADIEIDVSNWVFKDEDDAHEFSIAEGTLVPENGYLIIAKNLADFQTVFPAVSPVIGDFGFGLSGGGELIRLYDSDGLLIDEVEYDDDAPWDVEADGNGPSLELTNPDLDNNVASSWAASNPETAPHGTPGEPNSMYTTRTDERYSVEFSTYPNPMKDTAYFTIDSSVQINQGNISIFNILGEKVYTTRFFSNQFSIQPNNLQTGVYNCNLYNNNQFLGRVRLIVE